MDLTRIEFKDKQGRKIVGDFIIPEASKPLPIVIICHGFKGNRNERHIKAIAEAISEKGIATLRFDFTKDPGESSLSFEDMTVSYELEVLDQAVEFVKSFSIEKIDTKKIAIVGHSLGGLVVGWYGANHSGISAVVSLSGVYSFAKLLERELGAGITSSLKKEAEEKGFVYVYSNSLKRDLKIRKKFFEDSLNYEMDRVIRELKCPVLSVHGTKDEAVSLEHSQHFTGRSRGSQKELRIIEGADHIYSDQKNLIEVKMIVAEWCAKVLLDKAN